MLTTIHCLFTYTLTVNADNMDWKQMWIWMAETVVQYHSYQ